MTQPCAVIDIVGAKAGAHELLEQVGLLVRALGRAETGERARTVAITDFHETGSGALHRLVPGGGAEMRPRVGWINQIVGGLAYAVLADHRLRQTLWIGDIVEPKAAFHAQAVLIGRPVL